MAAQAVIVVSAHNLCAGCVCTLFVHVARRSCRRKLRVRIVCASCVCNLPRSSCVWQLVLRIVLARLAAHIARARCVRKLPVQGVWACCVCDVAVHVDCTRRQGKLSVQVDCASCRWTLRLQVVCASCLCRLPVHVASTSCARKLTVCVVGASCQCTPANVVRARWLCKRRVQFGRAGCFCGVCA